MSCCVYGKINQFYTERGSVVKEDEVHGELYLKQVFSTCAICKSKLL